MENQSKVETFKTIMNPFSIECVEEGTDLESLRYLGRGERRYGIGRQLFDRGCDDALVGYDDGNGKGILLIRRNAEPAKGYLWPLGGFTDRGVRKKDSLASRIENESGLKIDKETIIKIGEGRMIWKTTPYQPVKVTPKIRDMISNSETSKKSVQEVLALLQSEGIYGDVSKMDIQSFADLVQERDLPSGIDDFGNLFYAEATGNLKLDFLHKNPVVVTPKKYNYEFMSTLHPYVKLGMDRAIKFL